MRDKRVQRQDWIGGASEQGANLTKSWPTPWRALGQSLSIAGVLCGDKLARPQHSRCAQWSAGVVYKITDLAAGLRQMFESNTAGGWWPTALLTDQVLKDHLRGTHPWLPPLRNYQGTTLALLG